ncbi:MAG: iron-sulfur cluster assembly scaffold protein [Deltaproteobacteria bacterium]|jgi:NifU-like protein involved in Fe-S cluster formation|nr:iron-sulfur cluster assembly scaffold protein [Deltaproteobacteria bacterium]
MGQTVIKYYRNLLRNGFKYNGSIDNPTIFLDSVGEKIRVCGGNLSNYMHIFIRVNADRIDDIKYLCMCDPVANVAAEILCSLVLNKTIYEAAMITTGDFSMALGSNDDDFLKKAEGMIDLLNRGISRYLDKK